MKQLLLLGLNLCLGGVALRAQSPLPPLPPRLASDTLPTVREYVEISPDHRKGVASLYKTISFLDSRADTSGIGMAEITDKAVVRLVLRTPVQPQLSALLTACSAPDPGDGELLFQIRRLSFAEPFRLRYFYLAATLYAKAGERYTVLNNVDTAILIEGRIKKGIMTETREVLYTLLKTSIGTRATGTVTYSFDELTRLDSLEKRRLPLYTQSSYVDGFYSTYAAFKDQQPDLHGEVRLDADGRVTGVKVTDKKWNEMQSGYFRHDHIYALVNKGIPYAVTTLGIWPLEKVGDDFYFTGELKLAATRGQLEAAYFMYGVGGALGRNAMGNKMVCRVQLDHQNGEFIHQKILAVE